MSKQADCVIVLDGDLPASLAAVRSLGRRGLRVVVGAARADALAFLSRYCAERFRYPDPMAEPAAFRKALREELVRRRVRLVIPVSDRTIVPLMEERESTDALAPLAMARNQALAEVLSKGRTEALARRLGIPVPRSLEIRSAEELSGLRCDLGYPCVVKPDVSKVWGNEGRGSELTVEYARDSEELLDRAIRLLRHGPVRLQERIVGDGVGLGVLCCRGMVLLAFQYSRLHEVPITGGASSYRVSEEPDPALVQAARELLGSLAWDGVAMLEFKRAAGGKTRLLEVNGRFWGSLALAVEAGADFPAFLYDLAVRGRRDFPKHYRVGVRCRRLDAEVEWLASTLRGHDRSAGLVALPSRKGILGDTVRMLDPRERWDVWRLDDPAPGGVEAGRLLRNLATRGAARLARARELRRMQRLAGSETLARRVRAATTITFVCHGNIARSAFAEARLRQRLPAGNSPRIQSAGIAAEAGRPAAPPAVRAAAALGIDLRGHRAQRLDAALAEGAGLVLVMEVEHILEIRRRFPQLRTEPLLLGCLAPEGDLSIADPIAQSPSFFLHCFRRIARAVDGMGHLLTEAQPRAEDARDDGVAGRRSAPNLDR